MRIKRDSRGFTLTEGIIAFSIILVVGAIAAPQVVRSVRSYRLGAAATDVANLIQRTRYEAIRRNIVTISRAQQAGGQTQIWIDYDNDRQVDQDEPFILLPPDVNFLPPGVAPDPASMGYPRTVLPVDGIAFDARGTVDFNGAPPAVVVVFIGLGNDESYGYRSIALTPAGKTRIWRAGSQKDRWH